ncbi:hypothetical protein ZYGM_000600 [Zygosaccharomyces mellis]|uniref:Major facilitator superfamily (MFS) profile domain-containing protein n=1 Tax=Zygosaccharomyces mellis TaxID=42258 RepID=A0A4C2EBR2_9SACH|nr:hypothetical protein ZYGM_000600 [Zygosaccharomyces mellis]
MSSRSNSYENSLGEVDENFHDYEQLPSKNDNIKLNVKTTDSVVESSYSLELDDLESAEAIEKNPFADPATADFYAKLYEEAKYESRKAYDPKFYWSKNEEKKLVRKLDFRCGLVACVMFAALQIDRGNLAQAVADNMLSDLNMTTDDYNIGNQLFYVCFLVSEIPSQLISKRLGPDRFIPLQMVLWSIVSMCQASMNNKGGFFATRCLIGILEGGFIADLVLWLSYFYNSKELTIRLSWFWTTLSVVQICTALLAFAILRMRGIGGLEGWKWLFLIEGAITFLIGMAAFYLMVPSAVQTKNWMHPKGWFTGREEKIVVNRVLRDDPSKGDMHNRQTLTPKMIWKALTDYDLWPIYAIGLLLYIPNDTIQSYLTLNLKQLHFSRFDVQLLTIPPYFLQIVFLLAITWFSEYVQERCFVCTISPIWATVFMGVIRWWKGSMHDVWGTYVLVMLMYAQPYVHAICVSWVSRNSNSIRTRAISSAMYNMFVQLGSICANQVYRQDDMPYYHRGNMQLFCVSLGAIPLFLLTKLYYVTRNKKKLNLWDGMSKEEQVEYINNTTDQGNKRLDFLFDH